MAIDITFYNFSKKFNSTKRPDVSGTTYKCNLIDDCSIINPRVVIVGADNSFNPMRLNYAFIASFDRHYYVNDWTYSNRTWIASLNVDFLASWRNGIGSSQQFVERSSAKFNEEFIDNAYLTKSIPNVVNTLPNEYSLAKEPVDGIIVVQILNKPSRYLPNAELSYALTVLEWQQLYGKLWDAYREQEVTDTATPLSTVLRAFWLPISLLDLSGGENVTSIEFPQYGVIQQTAKSFPIQVVRKTLVFELPNHPQKLVLGKYLNAAPYTRRTLIFPYIGRIAIDPASTSKGLGTLDKPRIELDMHIDAYTGKTYYFLNAVENYNFYSGEADISIDLVIAQRTNDPRGIADNITSAVSNVGAGVATSLITGNPLSAIWSLPAATNGILNAVWASLPQISISGTRGSFGLISFEPIIKSEFFLIEDWDFNRFGRPYGKRETISNIPGFIKTVSANISLNATDYELERILATMDGGFYYE